MKEVNVCKRFTDAVGFIAVVGAVFVILLAKKEFEPTDDILVLWQKPEVITYMQIAIAFFVSALINCLTHRQPTIGPIVAFLPLLTCFDSFSEGLLTGRPMIYILCSIIHLAGTFIYLGQWLASGDRPVLNSGRAAVTGIVLSLEALALWLGAHFFLSMRYRVMFTRPFYILTFYGLLCGIFALAFYFKARGKDDRAEGRLYLSISSITVCLIVIFMRVMLSGYGF